VPTTVVFRPFVGEVMVGKIRACTKEGIQVSLEFFDDIIIPSYSLQVSGQQQSEWYFLLILLIFAQLSLHSSQDPIRVSQ
jgi:DNA-directed RNA polymerase subunit E'/Rpb7